MPMLDAEHDGGLTMHSPQPPALRADASTPHRRKLFAACAALASIACHEVEAPSTEPPAERRFAIVIEARADHRDPVAGAEITAGTQRIGVTDSAGRARVSLAGVEGERATLGVRCPTGFASPERPLVVGLRRLGNGSPPPKFEVDCVPLVHSVLVGIQVENGPGLPILHLKKRVGQTDEHGIAHVLLPAASEERVALTLDTSQNQSLRPQNPTLSFVMQNFDEFVLLEQKFVVQRAAAPVRTRRRGPQPL